MCDLLDTVHITVNKNKIPNDPTPASVTSGIRLGTPAATTRGFKEDDMKTVAGLIALTITDYEGKADFIRSEVNNLCDKYPLYS